MDFNSFNENFEFIEDESNSYPCDNINYNLLNNFNFFSSLSTVDFFQNETQYTNRLYYKPEENQPLLNKNNNKEKEKDDNDLNKPKEKIIFKIEHTEEKKIISVNKKTKSEEINNRNE